MTSCRPDPAPRLFRGPRPVPGRFPPPPDPVPAPRASGSGSSRRTAGSVTGMALGLDQHQRPIVGAAFLELCLVTRGVERFNRRPALAEVNFKVVGGRVLGRSQDEFGGGRQLDLGPVSSGRFRLDVWSRLDRLRRGHRRVRFRVVFGVLDRGVGPGIGGGPGLVRRALVASFATGGLGAGFGSIPIRSRANCVPNIKLTDRTKNRTRRFSMLIGWGPQLRWRSMGKKTIEHVQVARVDGRSEVRALRGRRPGVVPLLGPEGGSSRSRRAWVIDPGEDGRREMAQVRRCRKSS